MHRTFPVLFNFYLLIHLPFALFGQDPYFINYDTKDGLPSSEVYDVEVDSNGMVWFATDRGICSYNGYEFKTYTTEDGLANNTLLAIWKDRKGNFWFPGIDGSLSIYDHEKFYPYKWNDSIKATVVWPENVSWDQHNKLYFWSTGESQRIKYSIDDESGIVTKEPFSELAREHRILNVKNAQFLEMSGYYLPDDKSYRTPKVIEKDSNIFYNYKPDLIKLYSKSLFKYSPIENREEVLELNNDIVNIYLDKSRNIWICTISGLYLITNADFTIPPQLFFESVSVTQIINDFEGNYWITTLQNGVFMIPSFNFQTILTQFSNYSHQKVLSIAPLEDHILFGTSQGEIIALTKKNHDKFIVQRKEKKEEHLWAASYYGNRAYFKLIRIKENSGSLQIEHLPFKHSFLGNIELANGDLFILGWTEPCVFSASTFEKVYYPDGYAFKNKIVCAVEKGNKLWVGTAKGLYSVENYQFQNIKNAAGNLPLLQERINDIKIDAFGNLWISTIGNGIICKTDDSIFQVSSNEGLLSKLVNHAYIENDSTIWVATNYGLNKLIYKFINNSLAVKAISSYTTTEGLITNFVNSVTKWNGKIWLATNKGINYFDPEAIDMTFPPPKIILEEIAVNDSTYNAGDILNLKHFQNDLYFKFTGISYRKQNDKPFYRYRLKSENTDSTWYFTNNRDVRFNDLLPGEYTFEVAAQNKHGQWSEKPVVHNFTIQPHFTQTNWFRMIGLVTIVGIIAFAFQTRSKRIKREEEQKRKVQEAELQALRNQMNPHFVFNALNSIQNFVFKNDAVKANYYLSRFSRLMRDGLQFARLKYISLEEEIIFLNTYLELEKMRFPDKFQYVIKVDEHIPASQYSIPPLLFQPILENAVKHAFKNIDYEGYLEICFEELKPGELLKVTITDNGEGIIPESVNKHTKSKDKSLGIEIINNQIALLNQEAKDNKASFRIFNRNTIDPQLKGTQAEFIISIKFSENDKSSHH